MPFGIGFFANSGPAVTVATGGTITTTGGYRYHTFNSSGTFTLTSVAPLATFDYLIVAGGGAGGSGFNSQGAGGGAGGYRAFASQSLAPGSFTVTVGAGGAYGSANGGDSSFNSFTSTGGGCGGDVSIGRNGRSGGSGGGAQEGGTAGVGNTPSTTPSQGNSGGVHGKPTGFDQQGSGGGAGAAGSTTNAVTAGATWLDGVQRAKGGGGSQSIGGPGGTDSTPNSGNGTGGLNGAGQSGVVIIRYPFVA